MKTMKNRKEAATKCGPMHRIRSFWRGRTVRHKHVSVSRLLLLIVGALFGYSILVGFTAEHFRAAPVVVETKATGLKSQLLNSQNGHRTWVLAFHKGDEVMAGITEFAGKQHVTSAHLTAIGAFASATLAWYDVSQKAFRTIPVRSEVEVVSLIGNITADQDNSPLVHIHCAASDRNGKMTGGHLLEAQVSVTLELFLTEEPTPVHKVMDDEMGLKLIE